MSKITNAQFIEKCKKIHGNKYDYSLVNYTNAISKVDIICSIHGVFSQRAHSHVHGSNCPYCSKTNKWTQNQFIAKCKEVHKVNYDYSLIKYMGMSNKIEVICKDHGIFNIKAQHFINGSGCSKCFLKNKKSNVTTEIFEEKANKTHSNKYDYSLVDYSNNINKIKIICPDHGIFLQSPHNHLQGKGCSKCGVTYSTHEEEIKKLLIENNITFKENDRDIIKPYELDFYLPNHKIAIEVNGIYWHSELNGKDKNYHLNKTNLCKEKGIKLIHIHEDEFKHKSKIVKSKLNSILNINKKPIYGRKCIVKEIDSKTKSKFLNKYHLQGNDKALIKLGLFYNNKLISVMTFCKRRIALGKIKTEENEYELSRFCNNFNFYIIGGASKLLKHFERNYKLSKVITYADKRWSTGDLYFKLGFIHTHDSKPNYWYIDKHNIKRIHRFNFRKSILNKKLKFFDINLTEWQNMKNNNWDRIWDCGNMVFKKSYK